MNKQPNINQPDEEKAKKRKRKYRPSLPGGDYRVSEVELSGKLSYEGLNEELRRLGYRTFVWRER